LPFYFQCSLVGNNRGGGRGGGGNKIKHKGILYSKKGD